MWHELDASTILKYSFALADKIAARTSDGISPVAEKILHVLALGK